MTDRAPTIRDKNFPDPRLADAMQVIDRYIRATLQWIPVPEFDALYTEPLAISLEQEPFGVLCARVRQVNALEAPIIAGGICPFKWDGPRRRALVLRVPGMTTGTTTMYRYNFAVVGTLNA